jgi:hypothetical protein
MGAGNGIDKSVGHVTGIRTKLPVVTYKSP